MNLFVTRDAIAEKIRVGTKVGGVEQRLEVIEPDLRVFRNDVAGIEIDVGEIRVKCQLVPCLS